MRRWSLGGNGADRVVDMAVAGVVAHRHRRIDLAVSKPGLLIARCALPKTRAGKRVVPVHFEQIVGYVRIFFDFEFYLPRALIA